MHIQSLQAIQAIALNSILTAHRPVNKPMTPDVRLHFVQLSRSRGHAQASAPSPMTAVVLFTKLHSNPADPMVINFHNCVPNWFFCMLHKVFPFPRLYQK
jgi:hypothetical protein